MTCLNHLSEINDPLTVKLFLDLRALLVFFFTSQCSSKLLVSTPLADIGFEKQQTFDISCSLSYYYMSVDIFCACYTPTKRHLLVLRSFAICLRDIQS
jgi:hypothetical protein